MNILYKNTNVHYLTKNTGSKAIMFLHGWGGSVNSFYSLSNFLDNKKTKHILIDFPPFGKSQEPNSPWELDDYVQIVRQILEQESIKKVCFVAHSFGGRVAICFANKYTDIVEKLIITGGAGIIPKKSLKKQLKKLFYKTIRLFNKKINLGSKDYKNLSFVMKKTFSNIINKDLSEISKNINQKTLLVYGAKDKETPIYMAKIFNKNIKNSKLIIYKKYGHFCYLENFYEFANTTHEFLKD